MSDENKTAAWQAHAAERERGEPRLAKCGHVAYRDHATLCIQDGCPNAAYVQHPSHDSPPVPSEPKCYSEGTRVYTADDKLLVDTYCGARKFKESQDLAKWIAANFPAAPPAPAAEPVEQHPFIEPLKFPKPTLTGEQGRELSEAEGYGGIAHDFLELQKRAEAAEAQLAEARAEVERLEMVIIRGGCSRDIRFEETLARSKVLEQQLAALQAERARADRLEAALRESRVFVAGVALSAGDWEARYPQEALMFYGDEEESEAGPWRAKAKDCLRQIDAALQPKTEETP